jgi:hypothetical protein
MRASLLKEGDIPYQHHFIVPFIEDRSIDDFVEGLGITPRQEPHGIGYPLGSLEQSFPIWIFTNALNNRPYRSHHFLMAGHFIRVLNDSLLSVVSIAIGSSTSSHV